ncbi:hypothetical protein [Amycolatopsis sp. TNS106]|uniref:hypothetical protein n=1 Tax=Amycolatopsis sp. TNS106 TaxID=2861750 RepID=UPI001C59472F|nr:hypothetical protein [Amycolatopsis sp. TNS106]QXV57434.1 hypothetical protein CVV72_10825 [Amycolatopsis sp. TNS106]
MTRFLDIPPDLYHRAEPAAGEILPALTGRLKSHRSIEQFAPDWDYVLSGRASVTAVVAALHCASSDVPEHAWPTAMRLYCPIAWRLLTDAGVSFDEWDRGRCDANFSGRVGSAANAELDGYAVFAVMDVPAAVTEIVTTLGGMPTFTPSNDAVASPDKQ